MKATDGEGTKVKTAHKAVSTKAKAKKPRGGTTTKKLGKKKAATSATKKKTIDAKKAAQKKQRISDTDKDDKSRSKNLPLGSDRPSDGKATNSSTSTNVQQNSNAYDNASWEIYQQHSEKFENDDSWNENYRRLQEFHSTHGHSGVPIHWSVEPQFADWVSRQRQIFREIHSGYRIATVREAGRWKRLRVLKFPLDYEKWHWRRKYNALIESLNGKKYDENDTNIPASLKVWVDHQRQLYESGARGRIDSERQGNLEVLGVLQTDDKGEDATSDDW
eukprot:CAMPEP_0172397558 /NCGR_PEP_ID=MMETSP1061-20121228/31276_1 /TAXON_ID=37318 /ORGANISM="Pseudo-nitzschia pungens, Strain cf. pungens" /LENGTH=275 /DNA_ID=CAMNT_0013129775 /DNA_START=104 /DNA_END=928 /DNA_ORIENTATION=-